MNWGKRLLKVMAELAVATDDAWEEFGKGITEARSELSEALDKAEAEFDKPRVDQ